MTNHVGKGEESLAITRGVLAEIVLHARSEHPIEACGLLAGNGRRAHRVFRMKNAEMSGTRFSLIPEEQLAVVKRARDEGLEIIAAYHSHPSGPPEPSAEDIRLAFDPELIHVVLSLETGRAAAKAYRIREGKAQEIRLIVEEMQEVASRNDQTG